MHCMLGVDPSRDGTSRIGDIQEDSGQPVTGVKIAFPVSHNTLTSVEEYTFRFLFYH
jgi:hypothetical protein